MNSFDSKAKGWDANPVHAERSLKIAEAILKKPFFKTGSSALEYGAGTGLLSFALQPRLGQITMADSSAGMLEVLKEKIEACGSKNMKAVRLDLTAGKLPDERYGMIYTQMTLHHVKDISDILGKFHALLNRNGALFVADLDKEDGSFHGANKDFDGHNGFDRVELASMARDAGFHEVEFETVFNLIKEVDGASKDFPIFLMSAKA